MQKGLESSRRWSPRSRLDDAPGKGRLIYEFHRLGCHIHTYHDGTAFRRHGTFIQLGTGVWDGHFLVCIIFYPRYPIGERAGLLLQVPSFRSGKRPDRPRPKWTKNKSSSYLHCLLTPSKPNPVTVIMTFNAGVNMLVVCVAPHLVSCVSRAAPCCAVSREKS